MTDLPLLMLFASIIGGPFTIFGALLIMESKGNVPIAALGAVLIGFGMMLLVPVAMVILRGLLT